MTLLVEAVALLAGARAPIMLLGKSARHAMAAVDALGSRLGAAVLTTPEAKSQVDETRSDSAGVFSFGANAYANAVVEAADAVIALGTDLGEFASRGGKAFVGKLVIQIVDDAHDVATTLAPDLIIVDDIGRVAHALVRMLEPRGGSRPWFDAIRKHSYRIRANRVPAPAGSIAPEAAISAIASVLPVRARLACDVTSAALLLLRDVRLGPERRLWCNIEKSACMGGALAAGIGVRLASGLPTLVLIGDWGLMMGSSELHTAASLRLGGFAVVVWSNAGGALIRCGVEAQGIDVSSDTHTWQQPTRFALVARGYGLRATRVRTASGLARALGRALRARVPTLIEAIIDPNAAVPAGDRYLHLDASAETAP